MSNILTKFQSIFNDSILPSCKKEFPLNKFTEPLLYTLELGRNRFRPCTALIAARISKSNRQDALIVALVSEIIHTLIIIQDDIADNDKIRRGKPTAWKKFGKVHSIFSCNYALNFCFNQLVKLSCTSKLKEETISLLWERFNDVNKGQIMQATLKLNQKINNSDFEKINLFKAGEGIWAIQAGSLLSGNRNYSNKFAKYAEKLGIAGMIKNDIEDIFLENNYDSFFCDVKEGIVTYPNYYFYQNCSLKEKKFLMRYFGKHKCDKKIFKFIKLGFQEKKVLEKCKSNIDNLVTEAICILDFIPKKYDKEKKYLIDWANNHRI